jgi:hypothetical protein
MNSVNRRGFAGVVVAAASVPAMAATPNDGPSLIHVFDLDVRVSPAQELGEVGGGRRRVIPITGGGLIGPGLKGEVLSGADWQTIRPDGVTLLQARYTIRMSDGATIGVINTGVRRAAPDVVKRLTAGEDVDPSLYYFRATPIFEVGPGSYQWLTENVFISTGARRPDRVELKVFKVA